jgi:septal ring factor EnvC (AmiA/AmiB activator)
VVAVVAGVLFGRSLAEPVGIRTEPPSEEAQQIAALQADARLASETITSLRAELQTARENGTAATDARAQFELRVTQAEQELLTLREQVTSTTAQLQEQQQVTALHLQQLAAFKECLSGYLVAIELGRQDSWNAANRALATVGDACDQARQVP